MVCRQDIPVMGQSPERVTWTGDKHLCRSDATILGKISPIVKLARPVEGTIHYSFKHIMATSGYFLTSQAPGIGIAHCTARSAVPQAIGEDADASASL